MQEIQVRLASLQAMQKVVLGEESQAVGHWLEEQGLSQAPRLVDTIKTEAGWEDAVETVLGECLESVCVEDIEKVVASCSRIKNGRLVLLDETPVPQTTQSPDTLASKVQAPVSLTGFLDAIQVADDLHAALKLRKHLAPGQSVITKEGIWMGGNWMRLARSTAGQSSVLQRKNEIRALEKKLATQQQRVKTLESDLEACQGKLNAPRT